MDDKLNIQQLAAFVARRHDLDEKDADIFVREFFALITESLEKDKYVKVRGLGTFKLITVESRESINVNTGARFEIQSHTKVSFTPDNNLKEIINRPFSHFEPVVLNDGAALVPDIGLPSQDHMADSGEEITPHREALPEVPSQGKEMPAGPAGAEVYSEPEENGAVPQYTPQHLPEGDAEAAAQPAGENGEAVGDGTTAAGVEVLEEVGENDAKAQPEQAVEETSTPTVTVEEEEKASSVAEEETGSSEPEGRSNEDETRPHLPEETAETGTSESASEVLEPEPMQETEQIEASEETNDSQTENDAEEVSAEKEPPYQADAAEYNEEDEETGSVEESDADHTSGNRQSTQQGANQSQTKDKPRRHRSRTNLLVAAAWLVAIFCICVNIHMYFPAFFDRVVEIFKPREETVEQGDAQSSKQTVSPANTEPQTEGGRVEQAGADAPAEQVGNQAPAASPQSPSTPAVSPASKHLATDPSQAVSPAQTPVNPPTAEPANKPTASQPLEPSPSSYRIVGTQSTYTIKDGETLSMIALRFYGAKTFWPFIVNYNTDIITNPDVVPPGITIKIPQLEKK